MKYRTVVVKSEYSPGEAGTEVIDINLIDIISRLEIKFRAQNGADGNSAHPAANVTKIELVDGSDVLFSTDGYEAQGINFYNRGVMPGVTIDDQNNHWNTAWFGLDFGRFLWDTELALDPKKFDNLQLKITYDENVCQTDADENYLSIYAFVFDEKIPAPRGFLMTKEIIEYVVAAAYKYVELPTDHLMKQIYIFGRYADSTFTTQVDKIRLSEDELKRIVFDLDTSQLYYMVLAKYGRTYETAYVNGQIAVTSCYVAPTDACQVLNNNYSVNLLIDVRAASADGGKFNYIMDEAEYNTKFVITGVFPHGCCPLLFYNDNNIDDWYDVTTKGSIELRILGGAAAGNIQVVTEQLRTY